MDFALIGREKLMKIGIAVGQKGETMADLISRQAAIDDLHGKDPSQIWDTADVEVWVNALPSAQPEPLTGKEKMIFLAAMAKEENICKQIDDEYRDCELYEDSLVRACQEIERKVRGALWT